MCYKDHASISAHAIADYRRFFTMFETGFMGSQHDSVCWRSTPLCGAIKQDPTLMPPGTMLLAEGAYPMSHWLMKPYPGWTTKRV